MDTSEEYANMYDAAKEIHDRCDEYRDDFYMIKTPSKFQWVPRQEHLQEILLPTYIKNRETTLSVIRNQNPNGLYAIDMIQDMFFFMDSIQEERSPYPKYTYARSFDSMEQLWLAYLMSSKHNKKWNGEEWV